MKKFIAVLTAIIMCLGLFAACGSQEASASYHIDLSPYDEMDLSEYVKVPEDLSGYEYKVNEITISDQDVDDEIQNRLEEAAEETEITEGVVDKGDTVNISFKGTLSDGSSPDGMNSDGTDLELGSGSFIEGFEEGLYGKKIGDTVTLDLKFPDPYNNNPDLSGQDVTFEVTIKSKKETKIPELNEEFIKNDSNGSAATEEEYRDFVKNDLQTYADNQAVYSAKQQLYQAIMADCEVLKYPEEEVEAEKARLIEQYKGYAESQQMEWSDFITTNFQDEDTFNEQLDQYVRESVIATRMEVLALCKQEGVEVTDEEYSEEIAGIFEAYGVADEEEFETRYGTTFDDYLRAYDVTLNLYVSKLIDKVAGVESSEEAEE